MKNNKIHCIFVDEDRFYILENSAEQDEMGLIVRKTDFVEYNYYKGIDQPVYQHGLISAFVILPLII